jgi:hypothetical protein
MLEGGIVEQYKSWFYSYRICASILYLDYYITQPVYSTWKQLDSTVFRCHFIYFIIFFSNKTLLVDIWFFIYLLSMAKYIVQIQTLFLVYVIVGCWRISWYVIFAFRALNIIKYLLLLHILLQSVHFCMSTESVLIIFPQISAFASEFNFQCLSQWSQRLYVKVQGNMVHKHVH